MGACIRGVGDLGSIDGLHPKTNTLQSILRDAWSERGKKWSQAIALVWACMLHGQASGLHAIQLTLESGLIPWLVVSRCFDESAFHCIFSAELHRTYFDWHPTIAKKTTPHTHHSRDTRQHAKHETTHKARRANCSFRVHKIPTSMREYLLIHVTQQYVLQTSSTPIPDWKIETTPKRRRAVSASTQI